MRGFRIWFILHVAEKVDGRLLSVWSYMALLHDREFVSRDSWVDEVKRRPLRYAWGGKFEQRIVADEATTGSRKPVGTLLVRQGVSVGVAH